MSAVFSSQELNFFKFFFFFFLTQKSYQSAKICEFNMFLLFFNLCHFFTF